MSRFASVSICESCWEAKHGNRVPVKVRNPDSETCAFCGLPTMDGIYVRADLHKVPFPPLDKESNS